MKKLIAVAMAGLILGGCSPSGSDAVRQTAVPTPTTVIHDTQGDEEPTVAVDETATVSGDDWVTVLNQEPVLQRFRNGEDYLESGDDCIIEFGGQVTVKRVLGEDLLVEYTAPGEQLGTPCPTGVELIVTVDDFSVMTEEYLFVQELIQANKSTVEQILAEDYYGEVSDAGEWQWIDVVNTDPVFSKNSEFVYGDTCGAGYSVGRDYDTDEVTHYNSGGSIQLRGEARGWALYEYTAYDESVAGTRCPSGVLFFAEN